MTDCVILETVSAMVESDIGSSIEGKESSRRRKRIARAG